MKQSKTIVGRVETIAFPELGIHAIEAKIDTGAFSTAIHASEVWLTSENEIEVLNFKLLDPSHPEYKDQVYKSKKFSRKKVRSSNGKLEKRFILKTEIILGGKKRITQLSLTDRSKMRYPVLVGRKVLKNGFLVDVSKKNLHKK